MNCAEKLLEPTIKRQVPFKDVLFRNLGHAPKPQITPLRLNTPFFFSFAHFSISFAHFDSFICARFCLSFVHLFHTSLKIN